ncbi:uncharacterized protein B0J16DRAFT_324799 [Fusarium flagelliforme]|uniref:uncharacterized protein n=1 Tax=Fusarium flagelliforme TaxID=2675880 RepID=UPI001E8ECA1E|nr:uncharacterized protein B0J16DRAFT_324799 [Fusarium flagelliforme]KAH7173298.1 hypothetical protein B0J16DRAFT_324799 [Fusarium flagelliforme]
MSCPWDTTLRSADGCLFCGAYGLIVCGRCGVDYSDLDDVDEDPIEGRLRAREEYEDDVDRAGSLDIERLDPIRHIEILFPADIAHKAHPPSTRFIRVDDPKSFLIYTSGACFGKGQAEPKAGWAFIFGPQERNTTSAVRERLEYEGPLGDLTNPTSNRPELRAIIGALRYRNWASEGFTTLTLATDSEYVVKGATEWIRAWLQRG